MVLQMSVHVLLCAEHMYLYTSIALYTKLGLWK